MRFSLSYLIAMLSSVVPFSISSYPSSCRLSQAGDVNGGEDGTTGSRERERERAGAKNGFLDNAR